MTKTISYIFLRNFKLLNSGGIVPSNRLSFRNLQQQKQCQQSQNEKMHKKRQTKKKILQVLQSC